MEANLLSPTLANKVYSMRSMRIAVLIGGPLVVGYLMAVNFKQLGEEHKVARTWLWSVVGFLVLMGLAFVLPDSIPNVVFAIINYGIAAYFIEKYQGAQIAEHIKAGGQTYKTYRAVIVALISFLILISVLLGCFAVLDAMGTPGELN